MRKYAYPFLFLFYFALMACDKEDEKPDTINPVIAITSPAVNTTLLVIETIEVRASIKDNTGLEEARVTLLDPSGNPSKLPNAGRIDFILNTKSQNLDLNINLSEEAATGVYMLIVETEDKQQNIATSTVNVNMYAPDLDKERFIRAFSKKDLYHTWGVDRVSYLTEDNFNSIFFYMLSKGWEDVITETYFYKFAEDFALENRNWTIWNADSDEFLNREEFITGLQHANFFKDWDINTDAMITEYEFSSGVFDRWDINNDSRLSKDEYVKKFYTYFIL